MAYKFPWTNYHELNLDWILDTVKKLFAQTEQNNEIVTQYDGRLTEVELIADNAQTAAVQAQSNSATALDLAQNAAQTATQAQQAAATAQQAAGQAQTAAGQALEAASTAQQTATQAQQTAQNFDGRITQAENNAASALQAAQAFDEQVQGAITAANNANEAATAALTTSAETARELAAQRDTLEGIVSDGVDSLQEAAQDATTEIETVGQSVLNSIPADYTTLSELVDKKADVIYNTAAGDIASFNDGADDMKIKNLIVNIEPVQSGSGDPSPDNVRPISGWTGAKIEQAGVNIWDEEWEVGNYDTSTGEKISAQTAICSKNYISIKPSTNYRLFLGYDVYATVVYYDKGKTFIGGVSGVSGGIHNGTVMTTPANAYYMNFSLPSYGTTYRSDISINYPATDTSYHAYTGNQISVNWEDEAGTVYGGQEEVVSGRMKRTMIVVDLGALNWTRRAVGNVYDAELPVAPTVVGRDAVRTDCICSAYKSGRADNVVNGLIDNSFTVGTSYGGLDLRVVVCDSAYTSTKDFKAAVSGVQLCYTIAEPQTYQLAENPVDTIYGTNNIWSDVGDTEVTYPADTKLYIDGKIAELQALILEH